MKPYSVYCHMATSIDGKVTGDFLSDPRFAPFEKDWFEIFYRHNQTMKNWLVGRVSFEAIIPTHTPDL